jgi:hypothetical protein
MSKDVVRLSPKIQVLLEHINTLVCGIILLKDHTLPMTSLQELSFYLQNREEGFHVDNWMSPPSLTFISNGEKMIPLIHETFSEEVTTSKEKWGQLAKLCGVHPTSQQKHVKILVFTNTVSSLPLSKDMSFEVIPLMSAHVHNP